MPDTFDLKPEFLVTDEAALRSGFAPTHEIAVKKCIDHIDPHARAFIERAPFLCIGTQSAAGTADVSPRGDPRGFVRILDPHTLLIPDRPGNNRLDTLSNILGNPAVGLLFLIPGYEDTLRVNGEALLTRDPDLLAPLSVNGRAPTLGIVVRVREVFLHCAKALRRSRLWDPEERQDRSALPSLMTIIHDQTNSAPATKADMDALDRKLEEAYRTSMY
ncbi:pyridoxamine 5'-phosphate oxidase family protein [Pseudoruegeria sp. SHC-113]|uniref:pyridoxamine 5'-phosphate oxidase family protein n=1 Tax=Pseudoruegeria sp. SHC-113 TaxID=2855439 RepID=UPI0021BB4BF4|nr:pyridoxamine 5'-phosphate oxidase family protein [Pseudoruegeria sp. SHC-113]MCT8158885.1 pyridoxamine 5'-phosphate oxidase family protein [Pseudoruegeria sp. SHC-113]